MFRAVLFAMVCVCCGLGARTHFSIVVCSYNNEAYVRDNLLSALNQRYEDYHIYYVDDGSKDGTLREVEKWLDVTGKGHLCTVIRNGERLGSAIANQYETIHRFVPDDSVVVILDGDDRLAHPRVLRFLDRIYSARDRAIWMTYGQFLQINCGQRGWCVAYPEKVIAEHQFREFVHLPSHLRTFYAALFKRIKKRDLCDASGRFLDMSGDVAMMLPMAEMAARGHIQFVPEILYLYNDENPISDHQVDWDRQGQLNKYVRALPKYAPLERLF